MCSLKKYLILSILIHVMIILILVEVHSSSRKDDPLKVIEVTIVNNISPGGIDQKESRTDLQGKNIILSKPLENISFGDVEKEDTQQAPGSEFPPSEIDPESSNIGGLTKVMGEARDGVHVPRGVLYEINLWKSRVQRIVEERLQVPATNKKPDSSLQTIFQLMVSRTGELLQQQLLKSSGNDLFDNSVQASLGKVSHLPPPPRVLVAGAESIDVTMSFAYPQVAK